MTDTEGPQEDTPPSTGQVAVAAIAELANKVFATSVVGPALSQLGLVLGDQAKLYRVANLVRINQKLDRILSEKGVSRGETVSIAASVGLPLLERASYQDNDYLQEMWANLLASSLTGEHSQDHFSLDITFVEVMHQLTRLDCEVLEYIVQNGFSGATPDGTLVAVYLDPAVVRAEFEGTPGHASLEKLINLGCIARVLRLPLSTSGDDLGLGLIPQDVMATRIGLHLYVAASGKSLSWKDTVINETEVSQSEARAIPLVEASHVSVRWPPRTVEGG